MGRRWKPDASHAVSAGIFGAHQLWVLLWDNFEEARRPGREIRANPAEICEAVVHASGETNATARLLVAQGFLEETEQASTPRNSDGHGSELPQNLLPSLDGAALLRYREGLQDLLEALLTVSWELNRHLEGVNDPSKNELARCPAGIALLELLDRRWLLAVRSIRLLQGAEHCIQRMKEDASKILQLLSVALAHANEIVDENVKPFQETLTEVPMREAFGNLRKDRLDC
jgi:hypothetical protein